MARQNRAACSQLGHQIDTWPQFSISEMQVELSGNVLKAYKLNTLLGYMYSYWVFSPHTNTITTTVNGY